MSNTENLGLKIPTLAEKNIHTTYVNNNEIIDEAYGQYLEDKETAQENIAMIETPVAQSNHTAGSYFMLDNVLHKATSNIASGEDIVSGSNATPITIEQALSALNSSVGTLQNSLDWDFDNGQYSNQNAMEITRGSGTKGTAANFSFIPNKNHTLAIVNFNLAFSQISTPENKLGIRIPSAFNDINFGLKEVGFYMWCYNMTSWDSLFMSSDGSYFYIENRNWTGTMQNKGNTWFRFYIPTMILPINF